MHSWLFDLAHSIQIKFVESKVSTDFYNSIISDIKNFEDEHRLADNFYFCLEDLEGEVITQQDEKKDLFMLYSFEMKFLNKEWR